MLVTYILIGVMFWHSGDASSTPRWLRNDMDERNPNVNHLYTHQEQHQRRTLQEQSVRAAAADVASTDLPTAAPIIIDYWPTYPVPSTMGPSIAIPSPNAASQEPTSFSVVVGAETAAATSSSPTVTNLAPPFVENTQNGTIRTAGTAHDDDVDTTNTSQSQPFDSLSSGAGSICYHRSHTFRQIATAVLMSLFHL